MIRNFDIIIIGGGHAGSEAAHAAARLGLSTLLLTSSIDQIATMPCNPAIGGPAKSHLVKEIDALGGIMGLAADATYLQMKTLNSSKGPAVRSLRAQSDKKEYSNWVRQYLEATPNLSIYQGSAKRLLLKGNKIIGLESNLEEQIMAKAIVLTAGTFLEGRIFTGDKFEVAGRSGEKASLGLSPTIRDLGLQTGRLKTGTPARLDRDTINFSQLEEAPGDEDHDFFSFLPNRPKRKQISCHITRTNERTHEIIRANIMKSPMYSGLVEASGPRYCPSIEDKVMRFPHNDSHHFFLEPEGLTTKEIYLQGCSTSLPIDVQWQIVRSLPGLSQAVITRPAYAVEYDYFPGTQFKHSFQSKDINGLFIAGQVLGTSGYEEAAAQGLMAGINAAIYACQNHETQASKALSDYASKHNDFVLDRSESYIGTLVDDLVTKEITDPYRILTSRSEYRLLLRQDNADQRLTTKGREIGLVDDFRWSHFLTKQSKISQEIKKVNSSRLDISETDLTNKGTNKVLVAELLKRPDVDYKILRAQFGFELDYGFEVETEIKYAGYIVRQKAQIKDLEKIEKMKIPENFDFQNCMQISLEARDKLAKIQPKILGQASRVGGVNPADISILSIIIEGQRASV